MPCFVAERGPRPPVGSDIAKIGYKGVETCELTFEDYACLPPT